MTSALASLDVLVVDGQSTGASPAHGHLLELGWARTRAGAPHEGPGETLAVDARLLALPEGATIPRPVARLTGIGLPDLVDAHAPAQAWAALREAAMPDGPGGTALPLVIHYARFEAAFLHALHREHAPDEPFPLVLVCTHELARRLLPGLPRRGLRALAGYLGHGVDELKRSTEHVRATAWVWRELVALVHAEHGVTTLAELQAFLEQPPPKKEAKHAYPMPRERRLGLPDAPGIYRMLRGDGHVLYVGKATSLRQRVNGYFRQHRRVADRTLEMLTQARDLRVTPTATALEAALLESDEIKAHAPPYNVMLRGTGQGPWFATVDLQAFASRPDRRHRVGPLGSRVLPAAWAGLLGTAHEGEAQAGPLDAIPPVVLEQLAWWGDPPELAIWRAGCERFASTWLGGAPSSPAVLARAGARIWRAWREAEALPPEDEPVPTPSDEAAPAWDPVRVAEVLERLVGQGAHELRRARWLCRLAECVVAWDRKGGTGRRVLVIERGAVVERHDTELQAALPVPPGWARTPKARRAAFDVATFDRLRVLTAELRRVAAEDRGVALRLGPREFMAGERLRRALFWV